MSVSATIEIPVLNSEEVVSVDVNDLPDDENDIINILQGELASLDLWLRFAVEYYRQGRLDSFANLLQPLTELHEDKSDSGAAGSKLFEQFGSDESVKKSFLDILNSLAAFHTVLGSRERDKQKRKEQFDKAKKYYDSAEGVDLLLGSANVGRAVLQIAQGQLGRAEKTLTEVEAFNQKSVPAILGKACAKYNGGNFREALKLYRYVFELNPTPPATVRLGLGYCYNKLGQSRLAQLSLERVLELQDDCVDAMVGLAVLHLNEERVEDALAMLKRAYELEPYNPSVLNHLANHYFYRAQYDKALKLANRAYTHSDAKAIRAESCFHMARAHHAQGNHQSALQYYTEAHRTNPDYLAPQFGLGQMHLVNSEHKKAAACFERVLRAQPTNTDALKALGYLQRREGETKEALATLTTASEHAPGDASIWLELGQLQQSLPGQLPNALKAYEKAAGILKKPPSTVPPELWSNLGAIRHRLGKLTSAEQAYGYAIKVATAVHGVGEYDSQCVTTQYNLGRLYEERGEIDKAVDKYLAILEHHPSYPDCFLRLASCAEAQGKWHDAIGWATKELHLHPKRPEAFCALGNIYLGIGDLKHADQQFKAVLERAEDEGPGGKPIPCKKDAYATGQLAWIQIKLAQSNASPAVSLLKACNSASGVERIDKATEMLKKVLVAEPSNLYAANSLGVICVARGRLNEARQIFTQVREASASCEAATINLAQLSAALGEHATAISLYDTVAKRVRGEQTGERAVAKKTLLDTLLLQARSHHAANKLAECKAVLYEAVRLDPTSHAAWHNLGLALLAAARHPDGPDAPPRSVAAVDVAISDARAARTLYRALNPSLAEGGAKDGNGDNATDAKGDNATGEAADIEQKVADVGDHPAAEGGTSGADGVAAAEGAAEATPMPPEMAEMAASAASVKVAEALGLTMERRRAQLRACEMVLRELEDEAERASEREQREAAEMAAADAKMAEFEAARQAVIDEEEAKKKAVEEAQAAAIAEQKARLAAKLEVWREKDAAAAAAEAAAGSRKKRRKPDDEEEEALAVDDEEEAAVGGAAAEEPDAEDAADDLFGSDEDDGPAEGEGGEGGEAAPPQKKRLRKGTAADAADDSTAGEALFGDDDEDDAAAAPPTTGEGSGGPRLNKRRKVIDEDEEEDDDEAAARGEASGEADAEAGDEADNAADNAADATEADAGAELFGDDDDDDDALGGESMQEEALEEAGAEEVAPGSGGATARKRGRVVDDDDDD